MDHAPVDLIAQKVARTAIIPFVTSAQMLKSTTRTTNAVLLWLLKNKTIA